MSCSIVLIPVVVASWPAIAGAVAAATAALGYQIVRDGKQSSEVHNRTELEVANVEAVAENLGRGEEVVARKGNILVTFKVDARGRFTVHVDGPVAKTELERIGRELAGAVVQQYVHRRLSEELAHQGFVAVEEERTPDRTIRMRVRRYT